MALCTLSDLPSMMMVICFKPEDLAGAMDISLLANEGCALNQAPTICATLIKTGSTEANNA